MEPQETIIIKENGRVFLILPDKEFKGTRQIGYIRDRVFHTFRNSNHIFRKFNALGLNFKLLKQGGLYFDKISIDFCFMLLETTREFFLENGSFLHFQRNKLEKQLFLSLDLFGLVKAEAWERDRVKSYGSGSVVSNYKLF